MTFHNLIHPFSRRCALLCAVASLSLVWLWPTGALAAERFISLASTTSTANAGLFDYLLPTFTKQTGIAVRVIAVGTGQAIRLAKNGDVDVLLVHHRKSEDAFVAEGFGVGRRDVMYNDFVVVGPASDPAGVRGCNNAADSFRAIAKHKAMFVSRGDDSGTHKRETEIWRLANPPQGVAEEKAWYRNVGAGMGATLNMASAMGAYTLSDRGTWVSFKNKGTLEILCEGDRALFNPYGVILVNPARFAHIKARDAQIFIDWLTGAQGQAAINGFRINGQMLFHAVAD